MPIRVTNLRLRLDEPLDALPDHLGRLLGVRPGELDWRILRKSLDTRDKRDIHFVCNAEKIWRKVNTQRLCSFDVKGRPGDAPDERHPMDNSGV